MSLAFSLRDLRDGESDSLLELHQASMGGYMELTWGPWDETLQRSFWAERLERGLLRVIEVDAATVGLLEVARGPDTIEVVNLELAPEFQGARLGTAILVGIQQEAADRGVDMALQVLKVNPARRLYERLGFTRFGDNLIYR